MIGVLTLAFALSAVQTGPPLLNMVDPICAFDDELAAKQDLMYLPDPGHWAPLTIRV